LPSIFHGVNLGAPELLLVLLTLLFVVPTVYGLYRAFSTRRNGWGVAIIALWFVGLGWLAGLVFLLGPDRSARSSSD
jgi:hypothetical protein